MPPKKPTTTGTIATPIRIQLEKSDVDNVVTVATNSVAAKMGISANALPASVKSAIATATSTTLHSRMQTIIQRDVDSAVKQAVLPGVKPVDMLSARMDAARAGINQVAGDANVGKILDDTAALLFKKYRALVSAGFSEEQSFDLLRAEVAGRSARNR